MNIIILGPQGSGKGTQAELIAQHYKIPTISVGRLYREEIRKKTKLGKKAAPYVLSGELVPSELTNELLKLELKKKKYKAGVIFDGFPRNSKQNSFFSSHAAVDYVILIDIPVKETLKRLGGRYICSCGETYNLFSAQSEKPKHHLTCDKCGRKLQQRADDTPRAIRERLKIYQQETIPIIRFYQRQDKLITINGQQEINKVFKDIIKALNAIKKKHDNLQNAKRNRINVRRR